MTRREITQLWSSVAAILLGLTLFVAGLTTEPPLEVGLTLLAALILTARKDRP